MRVAHLVQQPQRLLELGKPALEHLFKEEGRANRAAQKREPLTGDRDLRWQWERDSSQPCGTNRRDLPPLRHSYSICEQRGHTFLSTMWNAAESSSGGPNDELFMG